MVNIIGTYECRVDAKGRLTLPAGLKKQLLEIVNEGFVLKQSVFHKCLELYPMSEWNTEVAGVNKLNRFVKKNNDFIRMFMAGVKMLDMDASGRLQISKDLIKFSGIKKEVVLSSSVNRIEIWDKESYEKVINDPDVDFAELAEDVMGNINLDEENKG
ncbi:MAG: division/cell wall cluster transcriptional repressor MraZ [Bacteroidetes bacterium]|nr:MAG: division/cell wall cluster transcriptional repressor MraZ [Bacteroidota bacterium]